MELVETDLDCTIDLLVIKSFCYGLSNKSIRILDDPATKKYVLIFDSGEDALNFKLKELDKRLIEIISENTEHANNKLFTTSKYLLPDSWVTTGVNSGILSTNAVSTQVFGTYRN